MRKIYILAAIFSLFLSQSIFADMGDSKACMKVAHACKAAGFGVHERFWKNCMKPVLYGKTVKGVKIDANDVSTCRSDKIAKMKKEISELEKVK